MNKLLLGVKCLLVGLLCVATQAQAVNYVFPGTLPAGCSGSGPSYSCGALTLGNNDTITFNAPVPATLTVNGNFSTDNAKINAAGSASNLKLVVTGTLTTGFKAEVNGDVTAGAITDAGGGQSVFGGSLTTTTGTISLAFKTTVAGSITTGSGASTSSATASCVGGIIAFPHFAQ